MFAIRLRVRPCSARSSPRSVGRLTTIVLSACSTCMRAGTCWVSSPSGPFTITRPGESETDTPAGSSMGCLPIRLIGSPDEADDFSADSLLGRGSARDQTVGGGQDRDAHPAEDARQPVLARIDAASWLRDPLEVGDHALAVSAELQLDHERVVRGVLLTLDLVVADVPLLFEEARDLGLGTLVQRAIRVPNPGEHVCNRVGLHATRPRFHNVSFERPPSYQLLLVMPGMTPSWASSRRQIRHSPNFLNTARGRPHLEALRLARFFDQGFLGHYWNSPSLLVCANGIPSARRSASPCSSSGAVVVIATSRPRTAAIES